MEGVNDSSATSDHQNNHGEEGEFHGLEDSIQNIESDEKLDDAENDEDAEVNGSSELEEEVVAGPRTSITQSYLDSPGLVEKEFSAHKKLQIPGTTDMTGFFAATLTIENKIPLLIEVGDIYKDCIFIACIQAKKNSDLQLMFIKTSWLEKCPAECEGIQAMKKEDGKKFL
jgi:hypothetical protein